MTTFKIPEPNLKLWLTAANMNWNLPEPDYIFHLVSQTNQFPAQYELVYLKHLTDWQKTEAEKFEENLWKNLELIIKGLTKILSEQK